MNTTENLNFGQAIEALKEGKSVSRQGWNGRGMFLFQANILSFGTADAIMNHLKNEVISEEQVIHGSTIVMKAADNKLVFGWLASQTDMMANDWQSYEV